MIELLRAVNSTMKEVGYVKKNAAVQGYKAVTHDDVVAALRGAMVENGLFFTISVKESNVTEAGKTKNNSTIWLYSATYKATLIHVSGESLDMSVESQALDHGDKASGKALSYATKYFLLKLFMLETGENDESRQEIIESLKESNDFARSKSISYIENAANALYEDEASSWIEKSCLFVSGNKISDLASLSDSQLNKIFNNYKTKMETKND
jgi:hypothetical protein